MKTGAKMATENAHVVDFRLTRNLMQDIHFIFAVCTSLSIALKLILCKK